MSAPKRRSCRWCGRRLSNALLGRIRKGDIESAHCASPTCTWGLACAEELLRAFQEGSI